MRLCCGATAVSDFAEHVSALERRDVGLVHHRCSGIRDVSRPLVDVARHVVHTERRDTRRSRAGQLDVASMCALDVAHRLVALPSVRIRKPFVPFACERPLVVVAQAFVLRLAQVVCFEPGDVHAWTCADDVRVLVGVDAEVHLTRRAFAHCMTDDVLFAIQYTDRAFRERRPRCVDIGIPRETEMLDVCAVITSDLFHASGA